MESHVHFTEHRTKLFYKIIGDEVFGFFAREGDVTGKDDDTRVQVGTMSFDHTTDGRKLFNNRIITFSEMNIAKMQDGKLPREAELLSINHRPMPARLFGYNFTLLLRQAITGLPVYGRVSRLWHEMDSALNANFDDPPDIYFSAQRARNFSIPYFANS